MSTTAGTFAKPKVTLLVFCVLFYAFLNCSSSQKFKAWFDAGKYEKIIQEGSTCSSVTEKCLTEKYYLAYSYFKLGMEKKALAVIKSASGHFNANTSPTLRYKFGLLEQQIILQYSKIVFDFPIKSRLIGKLLAQQDTLERLEPLLPGTTDKNQLLLAKRVLKAETFLQRMDITPADSLKEVYFQMKPLIAELKEKSAGEGYDLYYDLSAKFKMAQPLLKRYIYSGLGDPEKLRLLCTQFWQTIKVLKKLPIYHIAYTDQIDYIQDKIKNYVLLLNGK